MLGLLDLRSILSILVMRCIRRLCIRSLCVAGTILEVFMQIGVPLSLFLVTD
jgi:hypothetical protein